MARVALRERPLSRGDVSRRVDQREKLVDASAFAADLLPQRCCKQRGVGQVAARREVVPERQVHEVVARVADDGGSELAPYGHQGSGVISSLPWATGLARLPADVPVQDGDRVAYYDLRHWLA